MNEMIEGFLTPTVMAAIVAGLVTLLAPRLAERAKRKANGAIERARQDTTLVGAAERLTRELIERLTTEIAEARAEAAEIRTRMRQLESRDGEVRAVLYGVLDDLHEMRVLLDRPQRPPSGEELNQKRVEMEERVRRGLRLWEDVA